MEGKELDYKKMVEQGLTIFPKIKDKLNDEQVQDLIDWLMLNVNKHAALKFSEPKQVLDGTAFDSKIEVGLTHILGIKHKDAVLTEPLYDSTMGMDEYSRSSIEQKGANMDEWRYLMYAFKCIDKNIEYDEGKNRIEDNYSDYFSTAASETIANCPRCNNTDVDIRLMQLRSIDEAATIKYVCNTCTHSFNPPSFNKVKQIIKI